MLNQENDKNEAIKRLADLRKWLEENANTPAEEMQSFFEKRIESYESVHLGHWGEEYQSFARLIPPQTKTLLDLGCGTGLELDEIFKLYPDIRVTGIDLTEAYLAKLRGKHPDKTLELINADYFEYPFENRTFDSAISFMTMHHFIYEKKGHIYEKLYQAIPINGCYIECDYMASCEEHEGLCLDYYHLHRKKEQIQDDVFVHIDIPLTVDHQKELMKAAGFKEIEMLHHNENTVILKAYK